IETVRRPRFQISLFSELMIGQSGIYCCPVLDNCGKKGCRGALAVFGARSGSLLLNRQPAKHFNERSVKVALFRFSSPATAQTTRQTSRGHLAAETLVGASPNP